MKGLKVNNPHGAFVYDVTVMFMGKRTTVEVAANTMTEAARLVKNAGYDLVEYEPPYNPWRDSIENTIKGENYFRESEWRDLLEDLDCYYGETTKKDIAALLEKIACAVEEYQGDAVKSAEIIRSFINPN